MADQYTPEEIAEIFEAYNNAIKTGTPISEELARQMQDAVRATRGLARAQEEFGKSLGRSALQLSNSLYKGEKGVGQFGDAIESAATALQTLILAIPGLGLAAKVATVAVGLLAKGANMAAKQGDALYKTYQDLGRAGATASDGITGVFRNMQNLGYGIEELDKMVQLVTQNSETLAKFSLTAADGTNAFAQGMAQIQRDGQIRLLGKTTDDINSAGAAFIRQQIAAGRTQKDIGDSLGTQTKAYIIELDRLQRLTGTSADVLQKQMDEAMAEDAFNQVMSELRARASAGDKVAEAQISKITETMARMGPEMRKEFILGIGGDVSAQTKLFMTMPSLLRNTMDETISTQQLLQEAGKDTANSLELFGPLAKLAAGGVRDTVIGLREQREFLAATRDLDARDKAAAAGAKVQDTATKAITEAQIANMNSRDAMQAFIQRGVAPATVALSQLAKVASGVTGLGAKAVGAPEGGAARGSAPGMGKMDYSRELYGTGAKGYLEKMIQAESGGRNIGNLEGTSSAFGLAQITKGTFEGLVRNAGRDNPLYGKTFDDMKADTKLQMEAARQLTDQNRQYLQNMGVSTSDAALYLAHFLGPNGAVKALTAGDSAPLTDVVSPTQLAANSNLRAMKTVADLKSWANQKMGDSGYQFGGIASGPRSGYTATLHGTEAIVPLPNGKTIPVEIPGFSANFADQTNLMGQQLNKLDELIRVMQNQVTVSTKILQAAN